MKLKEILGWLSETHRSFVFHGDEEAVVDGFASLDHCEVGKITWVKKKENYEKLADKSGVFCAVIQEGIDLSIPNQIISSNSKEVFFAILNHFWGNKRKEGFIGTGTVISENAVIDPSAYIGYNCSIIGEVKIGARTIIENNVVISGRVSIGEDCHIQSCTVIGEDGFGYSKDPETGKKTMVEHFGGVRIGDSVFIGSNVNIERGTIDDTVLENGVKISPSVLIGHNDHIGENTTVICSCLYGSVRTGKDAYITASIIQNQTEVGRHTVIGMGSVVTKPVPDDVIAFGVPAKVIKPNNSDL